MARPLLLALLLAAAVAGCAATPPPADAPRTVAAVDLGRYAGVWYEVARYPNRFEDGDGLLCADVTATYTPRPDGRIGVANRCRNAAAGGAERVARGRAYAVEGGNGARLRVSFFWPFYGDYWVFMLAEDYRYSVVGDPERKYLWILARDAMLEAKDREFILKRLRAFGYDPAKLFWTDPAIFTGVMPEEEMQHMHPLELQRILAAEAYLKKVAAVERPSPSEAAPRATIEHGAALGLSEGD